MGKVFAGMNASEDAEEISVAGGGKGNAGIAEHETETAGEGRPKDHHGEDFSGATAVKPFDVPGHNRGRRIRQRLTRSGDEIAPGDNADEGEVNSDVDGDDGEQADDD